MVEDMPKEEDFDFSKDSLQNSGSTFHLLANLIQDQIYFRQRAHDILVQRRHSIDLVELEELLDYAKRNNDILMAWPYGPPQQQESVRTFPGTDPKSESRPFPPQILYYDTVVQAGTHNGWRISRILQLNIVAQIYRLLRTRFGQPTIEEEIQTRSIIDSLVDDICSSIPYYLGWRDKIPQEYRDLPEDTKIRRPCKLNDPEMIANWSQFMPVLWSTVSLPCVQESKRKWLKQYLIGFSDGRADVFDICYFSQCDAL